MAGFERDADGRLLTVSGGAGVWSGGFLRGPGGELVISVPAGSVSAPSLRAVAGALQPVSSQNLNPSALGNGTDRSANYRLPLTLAAGTRTVRFKFGNWYVQNGSPTISEVNNPTAITFNAALELSDGGLVPLANNVTLGPGQEFVTDLVDAELASHIRTYVTVASGAWPLTYCDAGSTGVASTTVAADQSLTAAGALSGGAAVTQAFAPMLIVGERAMSSKTIVAIVGDSIATGFYDNSAGNSTLVQSRGYIRRALDAAGIPSVKVCRPSERITDVATPARRSKRWGMIAGATHAVVQHGINDLRISSRTAAQMQTDYIAVCNGLKAKGMKVVACTLTPDNGLTTGLKAERVAFNTWLRTMPSCIDFLQDTADAVEVSRNSGTWKSGYNADGVHPNEVGHSALVDAFSTSVFSA